MGEQVVGNADGQLLVPGQLLDDLIIVRVVLITAAGIDGAGDPQAIEFAHELAGGIDLILQGQFRAFGEGRVQNHRVRTGDQHARRLTVGVALDLAARRIRGVAGVAHHFQCRAVEQGAVVEVQDEYGGVRCGFVQFFNGRQAFFGELELVPATDHPHPLRRWCAVRLVLEQAQGVDKGGYAFPAQFKVVIEPSSDQVQVRVVETGNHRATVEVDDLCAGTLQGHGLGVAADHHETSVLDRDGAGLGFLAIDCVQASVVQNEVGRGIRHGFTPCE